VDDRFAKTPSYVNQLSKLARSSIRHYDYFAPMLHYLSEFTKELVKEDAAALLAVQQHCTASVSTRSSPFDRGYVHCQFTAFRQTKECLIQHDSGVTGRQFHHSIFLGQRSAKVSLITCDSAFNQCWIMDEINMQPSPVNSNIPSSSNLL
jgi:Fanconi anemia group J protein